ncbi:TRAP transporter substrate-binding protein [uncultured Castellaniella sp.]|jgi:tripartite ATP-independent transporter DctP family solute receptor|uniref:TRAP transporter substrate-binding protein n=1 Tax=uncultured Castellaniella sp. TaxID=647907 RepID=UPI002632F717|nr:TRAP transporter substrate-binding protein [uncultured Castellaniella sp.]
MISIKKLATSSAIAALACVSLNASAANIKVSTNVAETSTWVAGAKKFKELVETRSEGRHTVQIYPNATLASGNDRVEIEMAQAGAIDIVLKSTVWLAQLDSKFMAISLPWAFPDADSALRVMDGAPGKELNTILRKKNLQALAWGSGGFFQLYSNAGPIKTPEDIAGVKIRTPGLSLFLDSWKAVGSVPVALNFSEVFSSLQAGAIEGGISPVPLIYSSRFFEVSKHISLVNFSFEAIGLLASNVFWSGLSEADQKMIQEAATEAMRHQRQVAAEQENVQKQKMAEAGVSIYTPTPEQIAAFRAKAQDVLPPFVDKIGRGFVDSINAELAKSSS